MQGNILFTLLVVAGLVVVWTLFLRSTRARWELAVLIAGTLGLLVLVILMFIQPRAAVPPTLALTIPSTTPSEAPTPTERERVSSTTEAMPSPTILATPSIEPATPSASVPPQTATATNAPTLEPTSTEVANPPSPTPRVTTTSAITATVGAAGGNIRSAPEIDDNIIGFVDARDEVVVVGAFGEWYLVRIGARTAGRARIGGGEGWIVSSLVEDLSQVPPQIRVGPTS